MQGLGGGGLMVLLTQAVVGDIVPPRRARPSIQGIFGAVFGVSSSRGRTAARRLLRGRTCPGSWIFYINLPLGVVALGVIAAIVLPRSHGGGCGTIIDYAGAGLLAAAAELPPCWEQVWAERSGRCDSCPGRSP